MKLEGLVLESKYGEYKYLIKGAPRKVFKNGYPLEQAKQLMLEFDRYICFVDQMARNQGWTTEDKELVLQKLEYDLHNPMFREMWIHETPKPPKPWPTYDETHHNQIPSIAQATGTVQQALAYETNAREPRPSVVEKLQEFLGTEQENAAVEDELSAV